MGLAFYKPIMMMKLAKLFLSILVTKWIADAASRAAHDPRVENVENRVRRWSSELFKRMVMTVLGAVFFASGLVITILSAAARLDRGLPVWSYRFAAALLIFLGGVALVAFANRKKSGQNSTYLGEGRRTRPQLIDAPF